MSRFFELILRDLDSLPVVLANGLRELREMDSRTRQLSNDILSEENILMEELKSQMRIRDAQTKAAKEKNTAGASSKKGKSKEKGGKAEGVSGGGIEEEVGMETAVKKEEVPIESSSKLEEEKSVVVIDEPAFASRRDALLNRRLELSSLMDKQTRMSIELYELLDVKIQHMDSVLSAVDTVGFSAPITEQEGKHNGSGSGRRKRKSAGGLSDLEVFDATLDALMAARSDPNEPLYCHCKRISYLDMVACENMDCPIEWYHFPCVGLTPNTAPEVWYCSLCCKSSNQEEALHAEDIQQSAQ